MGTIVHEGAGRAVVFATGTATAFGKIAVGLTDRPPETAFQAGLRGFSRLLVVVAGVLTVAIFAINIGFARPFIDALLFSLAIAVGITPEMMPAIVTVSLSAGSRELARQRVLVKRLVTIEDLGNIQLLFTDKTGTLTEGAITFDHALDPTGADAARPFLLGLVCNEASMSEDGADRRERARPSAVELRGGALGGDRLRWSWCLHPRRSAPVRPRTPDGIGRRPRLGGRAAPRHEGGARGRHGEMHGRARRCSGGGQPPVR